MVIQNKIDGSITLDPIWYEDAIPEVSVKFDDDLLFLGPLKETTVVKFSRTEPLGHHRLSVELHNKQDSDTKLEAGLDKAVSIKEIEFFGITSPQFVWEGVYRPIYPLHIKNQPNILKYHNYLGWNGIWSLDFEIPIFTWIHRINNLGWIYT